MPLGPPTDPSRGKEGKHMLKIAFIGDSITEGAGASKQENAYPSVCCRLAHAKELNYGLSGSRIARQKVHDPAGDPDEDYCIRAKWVDRTADFVFVMGGTNDFGHGDAPLGKFGDATPYTFYGAVSYLIDLLTGPYGFKKEKICFVLPTPRWDMDRAQPIFLKPDYLSPKPLMDYIKAIKEVCASKGIDCYQVKGLMKRPPQGKSEFYVDGLHPSDEGHAVIGKELYGYLKSRGIAE